MHYSTNKFKLSAAAFVAVILTLAGCHSSPVVDPEQPAPVVTQWESANETLSLTSRKAISLFADSLGLVVATRDGLFFRPKNSTQTTSIPYTTTAYELPPTFYKGMAYRYSSTNLLTGIPYAYAGSSSVSIPLNTLDLPPLTATGRQEYSIGYPIVISNKGQMLFQIDDFTVPQHLYSLSLNASGRPASAANGRVAAKRVLFPDASYTFIDSPVGSFYNYGFFTAGDQLFTAAARRYSKDSLATGELQRITPTGTVEAALPKMNTRNLVGYNNSLYAIATPIVGTVSFGMYKSSDNGRNWTRLYSVDDLLTNANIKFYVVANHVVANLGYKLSEVDLETGKTKDLPLNGLSEDRGILTGLIAYDGKLYLSTDNAGVYTRKIADLWP